jgi:hypothetical protein
MADVFYGVDLGGGDDANAAAGGAAVVKDTSTTSKKIELRIEQGVSGITGDREVVKEALRKIERFILSDSAAPL